MTAGNYVNSLLVSVRLDILRSVKLNTRREILYLRAPMHYPLFLFGYKNRCYENKFNFLRRIVSVFNKFLFSNVFYFSPSYFMWNLRIIYFRHFLRSMCNGWGLGFFK